MKKEWETKRLGDFAVTVSTGPFGSMLHKSDYVDDGVPLVNPINIVDAGFVPDPLKLIGPDTKRRLSSYVLRAGDVVVARRGEIGRCAVIASREDGWVCGTGSFFIRPLPTLDSQFLAHLIRSDGYRRKLEQLSTGTTMRSLSNKALSDLPISVPPLSEQQRIAGVLDEAFAGLAIAQARAEKNLQNARALFKSHLQSVFTHRGEGWVGKRLEDIGTTQTGSTPKSSDPASYGNLIPFVKPADFNVDGSLEYENDGLSERGLEGARRIAAGSVLMVCIGATIGKCGYCDRSIATNQQINAFTPTAGVSHKLVYYQMLTENFQRSVMRSAAQATLPIINKKKWSALTVVLPPTLKEQHGIVEKLDALSNEAQHLESLYERKLSALDALKKSLLHQAFSGAL